MESSSSNHRYIGYTSMTHLTDVGMNYIQHLIRAWSIASILIIHGVFPNVWKTRANELLCDHDGVSKSH
jgi:hypothetical protein